MLILAIVITIYCYKRCKGRPKQQNTTFIHSSKANVSKYEPSESTIFRSGVWSSLYFQHGRWHGPFKLSLSLNPQSMKATGTGSDDVGTFTIDGEYSTETRRFGLTKRYQAGTGNRAENLAHQVIIQLTWNAQTNQFEGKWYVQTSKYHGEDKFELRFEQEHSSTAYGKV